jgi:hypothetical protein
MKTLMSGVKKNSEGKSAKRGITMRTAAFFASLLILSSAAAHAAPGQVLPSGAKPLGYSIDDTASAVADFSITGNDPAFYPDTPFQIIYRRPGNTFTVKPGTFLYVKFFFVDDAPPTLGSFPTSKSGVEDYFFGGDQLGGHDLEIEVDGTVTSINSAGYVGGPVATPGSPDGSTNILQIGAFISPLNKGTHQITIRGVFDGQAIIDAIGGPFPSEITYTVIVN